MNIKSHSSKKSFTLIELVAVIVVLGVAIPTLMGLFADANFNTVDSEAIANTLFYAEEIMEEVRSKEFSDPDQTPVFGTESGEAGRSDYDDVDDYNGYSDTPVAGFSRSVVVEYAELGPGDVWQAAASPPTDYKKITVSMTRIEDGQNFTVLVVLATEH